MKADRTRDKVGRRLRGLPRSLSETSAALGVLADLRDLGWQRTLTMRRPLDADGDDIPWMPYAAVRWLELVVRRSDQVFEYGAGASTVWFSKRCGGVTSVEHNSEWAKALEREAPRGVQVLHRATAGDGVTAPDDDGYVTAIREGAKRYDIVVIDGRARVSCAEAARQHIEADGLVIVDDADRRSLAAIHEILGDFGRVDFFGPKPGLGMMTTTSVFSTDFNARLTGLLPPPPQDY